MMPIMPLSFLESVMNSREGEGDGEGDGEEDGAGGGGDPSLASADYDVVSAKVEAAEEVG